MRPVDLSEPIGALIDLDEAAAIDLMRGSLGVDVVRTFQFWESTVARVTTGVVTSQGCPWDVELEYGAEVIRIEVKFSQEFNCRFASGQRGVFKFAFPKGQGVEKASHVTVFVGLDKSSGIHSWVVPSAVLPQSRSITMTSPNSRALASRSLIGGWYCPPTQILPEVLRAWRYDQAEHQRNARVTRFKKLGQGDFGL